MRLIDTKNPDSPPASLVNGKQEQELIALNQDRDSISDKIFKGDKIPINDPNDPYHGDKEFEVRYLLRVLFHNKCAYCECKEYKPDVEHYRPKKRITGPQRNKHGYYWLCYEWTNLLPACSACNSRSGKWDKFPIGGNRVTTPPLTNGGNLDFEKSKADSTYLQNELPLLIHPELEEPTLCLNLKWNGKLNHNNLKGENSIDIYDLNRGNLIKARKEIIDDFINFILLLFNGFRDNLISDISLQELLITFLKAFKDKSEVDFPYSFVRLYICRNFNDFVDDNFSNFSNLEKELLIASFPSIS